MKNEKEINNGFIQQEDSQGQMSNTNRTTSQYNKSIRIADLFGGVGGFRLGFERACNNKLQPKETKKRMQDKGRNRDTNKHRESICSPNYTTSCVFYCDNDKYAVQTYNKNFGENWEATDIRTIEEDSIPDFDILCGGFPCQAFSIAGKRKGFEDTRGTLFFEIARIIKAKRPKIVFLENVKGLLNHQKGETFRIIIQTISELGYDVQWMVLNSKFFGVPQNRERVFIIGSLRGEPRPEILPFEESYSLSDGGGQEAKIGLYAMRGRNPNNPSDRTTGSPTEQRLELNKEGTTNTLSSVQKDNLWVENMKIRRLTPTECERLQGFPDGWTEGVSDTQRYKQMGNAVTVNVIEAIARRLIK